MGKFSTIQRVSSRIISLRRIVRVNTQKMREKTLRTLEDMFDMAASIARGEIKTQIVKDRQVPISLKQRQMWARVAAYIAQIMSSIADGFDERSIDAQLDELERMVSEAKTKAETREPKEADGARGAPAQGS